MPEIERIELYNYKNTSFKRLKDIKTNVENDIGSMIDLMEHRLTPKQALNLLQIISDNKAELRELLNVTTTEELENGSVLELNILDL